MLDSTPSLEVTLPQWIGRRAQRHGRRPALTFIADDGTVADRWSYGDLWARASAVAEPLRQSQRHTSRLVEQPRALLLYPPGLEFMAGILGCQMAGWIPVPTCYPKPGRVMPRLDSAASDCHPQAIICDEGTSQQLDESRLCSEARGLLRVESDAIGRQADFQANPGHSPESLPLHKDALALLQYTSGSTNEPKGVMVRHRNLMANLRAIQRAFQLPMCGDESDRFSTAVFWLPFYHDMGLIGGLFASMYLGYHVVLHSPRSFLQRPVRWLQLISEHRAVVSGAPNFAYQLCVDRIPPEQTDALDLRGWKTAFCGAEPILPRTLSDFGNRFAACGFSDAAFYPCYGLAEATLLAAGGKGPAVPKVLTVERGSLQSGHATVMAASPGRSRGAPSQKLVCCGVAVDETELVIVDPQTRRAVAERAIGEIWLRGSSIAAGYWNRDAENRERFDATLIRGDRFHLFKDREEHSFFRTGDLGFLHQGELYVTGRLKDVIILRGRNHYPQDIESSVREALGAPTATCAAFSVPAPRGESLAVVAEVHRHADIAEAPETVRSIRRSIIETHEIDPRHVWLVRPATIPVTTSGKVQRAKCRALFAANELATRYRYDRSSMSEQSPIAIAPLPQPALPKDRPFVYEAVQSWLIQWLIARAGVEPGRIDVDRPFGEYGLDSMTAVELSGELEEWTGIELTPAVAWNHPTIRKMSEFASNELCGLSSTEEGMANDRLTAEPQR